MIIIDMLKWWYATAWLSEIEKVQNRTIGVFETFSVILLARTLLSPFRQIDAGGVRGPIGVQLRAWFDRTFSRLFGAVIRSVMIVSGCISTIAMLLLGVIWAAFWLVIPVLPLVGLIMMVVY